MQKENKGLLTPKQNMNEELLTEKENKELMTQKQTEEISSEITHGEWLLTKKQYPKVGYG